MYLIEMAAFVLAIILLHSLLGKLGVFRAFFEPAVHAIALRELTAINKRADLVASFGHHDGSYKFKTTLSKILAARPWWRWIVGNIVLEAGLIYALLSIVFGNIAPNIALVSFAAVYYAVSHFLLVRGFKAVRHEVEEEITFGEQARRARLDKLAQERVEREER